MLRGLAVAFWKLFWEHGIGLATWITAAGIIATTWLTYWQSVKKLKFSSKIVTYSNAPEEHVVVKITNVKQHPISYVERVIKRFDGSYIKNQEGSFYEKTLEEYDSTDFSIFPVGERTSVHSFSLSNFKNFYYLQVIDLPGQKYRYYPQGRFKSWFKRLWYWASRKRLS